MKGYPVFHIRPGGAYTDRSKAAKASREQYGHIADSIVGLSRADLCLEELMITRGGHKQCRICGQSRCVMKKNLNSRLNWVGWAERRMVTRHKRDRQDNTGKVILLIILFLIQAYAAGLAFDK